MAGTDVPSDDLLVTRKEAGLPLVPGEDPVVPVYDRNLHGERFEQSLYEFPVDRSFHGPSLRKSPS